MKIIFENKTSIQYSFRDKIIQFLAGLFLIVSAIIYVGWNLQLQIFVNLHRIGPLVVILTGFVGIGFVFFRFNEIRRMKAEGEINNLNQTLSVKLREIEVLKKELESFSYSVSHDLRAPLRAMVGFSNILMEDLGPTLEKSDLDYLNRIILASEKMSRLIDGLLGLSKLIRTPVRVEQVDIQKIVQSLVKEYESLDGKREVVLKFNAGHKIWADETLLGLLLQNLLGNAWKFTSKVESPRIEIGSFKKDQYTAYYVKDNGAGFDMKYVNKLFGTFQRLHFESEFQGIGIGLATSKRIVLMHGGEIWAEGIEKQGATIYFYLQDLKLPKIGGLEVSKKIL